MNLIKILATFTALCIAILTQSAYADTVTPYDTTPTGSATSTPPITNFSFWPAGPNFTGGWGQSVSIIAQTAATGIAGVQFKADGWLDLGPEQTVGSAGSYHYYMYPSMFPNGTHAIQAVVRDTTGHFATSTLSVNISSPIAPPVASAPSGTSNSPLTITLSAPGASSIRYTIDSTDPAIYYSTQNSLNTEQPNCNDVLSNIGRPYLVYTGPLVLRTSAHIQAIACYKGQTYPNDRSGISSFSYTINTPLSAPLYGPKIVVRYPTMSTSTTLSFALPDFQKQLKQMTGYDYPISNDASGSGIQLILANSPDAPSDIVAQLAGKGEDAFYLRGDSNQLKIVANTQYGLAYGAYYYLQQLGARWLLPGDRWTIMPSRSDMTLTINKLVAPAFDLDRNYGGTGGWSSYVFNLNYPSFPNNMYDTFAWQGHLGYFIGQGSPGGHALQQYMLANQPLLLANPDYIAEVGCPSNCHSLPPDETLGAKINAANPAAVQSFCSWVINTYGPQTGVRFLPLESDDGPLGDNYPRMVAAGVGDGSWSDQAFYIANKCMQMARAQYPGVLGSIAAYSTHADPPTFPVDPGLVVQLIPYAYRAAYAAPNGKTAILNPDQFINTWYQKTNGSPMSVYDYWDIADNEDYEPTFDYHYGIQKFRSWYQHGITGAGLETTYGNGTMGPALYLTGRLMWDPTLDENALTDEWYTLAFGPAKAPMQRMIERWMTTYSFTGLLQINEELGQSYQDIQEAESLAAGNPAVQTRIDDYAMFLQYIRLSTDLQNAPDFTSRDAVANQMVTHMLDMDSSGSYMVQVTRVTDILANRRGYTDLKTNFAVNADGTKGPGWANVHALSHTDIMNMITAGMNAYPPYDFTIKQYSGPLVPLQPITWMPPATSSPWGFVEYPLGEVNATLQVPVGLSVIPLRLAFSAINIKLTDVSGNVVYTASVPATSTPGTLSNPTWYEVDIPVTPGTYSLTFHPAANGSFLFQTWKGIPITLQAPFRVPKPNGLSNYYFYVPVGQTKIIIYVPDERQGMGAVYTPAIVDPNGHLATINTRNNGRLIVVTVPPGQDGKVWSMYNVLSPNTFFQMLTTPNTFSIDPQVLMVPSDAVAPIVSFSASSTSVIAGLSTSLAWNSPNANSCTGVNFISTGTSGSMIITPAQTTTYSITCMNQTGSTTQSVVVTVVPDTVPPSAPQNISTTVLSGTQIHLSWNASTDNVAVAGYKVYRDGLFIGTTTAGVSYDDTGLTPATTYNYTVVAYDAAGNISAQSVAATASTLDTIPPTVTLTAPMSGSTVSGSITISATSSDNVGVTSVLFFKDADTNPFATFPGMPYSTVFDTWTLANGTHTFFAQAFDMAGNKATSPVVSVTVNNIPAPTVTLATNPTAITAGQSSTLTWSSTNTATCTGTGFTPTGVNGSVAVMPSATTTYSIVCTGQGGTSNTASATVTVNPDMIRPSRPSVSVTAVTASVIQIAWNPSTDNVGVAGYTVYRNNVQIGRTIAPNYNDTGLAPHTLYSYQVKAYDAAGNVSIPSEPVSTTTASVN